MKPAITRILTLLLLVGTAANAQVQAEVSRPSGNLLENGSFEDALAGDGLPLRWSNWSANDGSNYRSEVITDENTGKKCLKIEGEGIRGVVFANSVKIDRNKRYALRGQVRIEGEKAARARIQFNYFHGNKWLGLPDEVGATSKQKDWLSLAKTDRLEQVPDASLIWISCVLEGKGTAWFDNLELVSYDKENLPEDFDLRFGSNNQPEEFKLLERHIGTWNTKTTIKPGVWVPDGLESSGVETVEWVLGKKFIQTKHTEQPGNTESISMMTYDGRAEAFRFWNFDSKGNLPRAESTGQWDAGTLTYTFKSIEPGEVTVTSTVLFTSPDHIKWRGIWRAKDGIVMEIEGAKIRKKQ